MKSRTFAAIITAGALLSATALAGSGVEAGLVSKRFHDVQADQLARIDAGLASGELSVECAATLYQEQGAVRGKYSEMAGDGSISKAEFDLASEMLEYAEQNINGRCITPR
ncbi:MAG: hypothetical protein AMXMBFR64_54730 [Myxococcales bacterium]